MAENRTTTTTPDGGPVQPDAEARRQTRRKRAAGIIAGRPPETKAMKFRRLANKRVPKALKAIGHVGNLANRSVYDYTEEQRVAVCKALDEAVAAVYSAFSRKAPEKKEWTL